MAANGKKAPLEELKERFLALFAHGDVQKKKGALPPKTHFSIWYFLITFLLIIYLQPLLSQG